MKRSRAAALLLALLAACSDNERPPDPRFEPAVGQVISERKVSDELGPRRLLTIAGRTGTDTDLLAELNRTTLAAGWSATRCVTRTERCYRHQGLFLAFVPREAVESDQQAAGQQFGGYLVRPATRQQPAEVFAVVQPGPPEPAVGATRPS